MAEPASPGSPGVKTIEYDRLFANVAQEVSIAGKTALVTGCSAGIGKALACALAMNDTNLVLVARRVDKLEELKKQVMARCPKVKVTLVPGDVSKDKLYDDLAASGVLAEVDFCIANAGLARGKEPVGAAGLSDWREMMDANCMGTFRLVNMLLPHMEARGFGHVVATGSIAGLESYEGGSVYCASKHALHAFMKVLRYETYSKNLRCTVVAPGFVGEGTEFSKVRFHGDDDKAASVYNNMQELKATDVAAQIVWALKQPPHVNIDMLHVMPTCQGGATRIHRAPPSPTK
jgi:3-hydroxy acid dehydrogenase/malonic semialdehyde reductase